MHTVVDGAAERVPVCRYGGIMSAPSQAAKAELAPAGVLHVGVNLGNVLLTARSASGGDPTGVAIDMGREVGRRLGVPVKLVPYDSPGQMAKAVASGAWDVAFLGIEPERAAEIAFSPPYVEIETTYLVRNESPFQRVADVDRPGVRIAVSGKSAYDLYLTRTIQHAHLERGEGISGSLRIFAAGNADVVAALRPMSEPTTAMRRRGGIAPPVKGRKASTALAEVKAIQS